MIIRVVIRRLESEEGVVESADPGVFDRCHTEYSSLVKAWILLREKSIDHDGADQRSYDKGYNVFLRL